MNSVSFVDLFPPEHVSYTIEEDKEYILPKTLPTTCLFTESWQVPNFDYDYSIKLVIRNSSGYISAHNELEFLQKNREIVEKNIIFQKPNLYETIENYKTTPIYQKLESIYNKINSNNFTLLFENNNSILYCDNIEICNLTIMTPMLRYYYLQYINTNNNNFNVSVDFCFDLHSFVVVSDNSYFDKEKLLHFSLHNIYHNIYVSYCDSIANISLGDMDDITRTHYIRLLENTTMKSVENDFFSISNNISTLVVEKFYNIIDVISNR